MSLLESFVFSPEEDSWLQHLKLKLGDEFVDDEVMARLKNGIHLKNISSILVESPYVDKDYRSLYYNFFAKKGLRYSKFCIRVHFFSGHVTLDSGLLSYDEESLYLGFVVLNPTYRAQFGRTILSPLAIKDFSGYLLVSTYKVHIFGRDFAIKGFPFMSQPTTISVCAHVSCWSIVRYFSQEFLDYSSKLVYEITSLASPNKQGGLIPSRGLYSQQAVRILSLSGLYPDTYSREDFGDDFLLILYSYIESGFPIYASPPEHAFCVIGHGDFQDSLMSTYPDTNRPLTTWDGILSLSPLQKVWQNAM
jgi:hypothetical protein